MSMTKAEKKQRMGGSGNLLQTNSQTRVRGKLCFCQTKQVSSDKNNLPSLPVGAVSSKVGNPDELRIES